MDIKLRNLTDMINPYEAVNKSGFKIRVEQNCGISIKENDPDLERSFSDFKKHITHHTLDGKGAVPEKVLSQHFDLLVRKFLGEQTMYKIRN